MTYKNVFISLAMLLTLCVAGYTTFMFNNYRPEPPTTNQSQILPDAYMENVTAVILDKYGRPNLKIITPRMVHYKQDDITKLQSPQFTLYRKSPNPWLITAKHAKAIHGIDAIQFWQDVAIRHAADTSNPATIIKTQTLAVHPKLQTAETNDPITMVQPNILVKATGMFADLDAGKINLLSNTTGEYVPSS